jgi:formate dehydrogenase iron-sulfur subunit
MDEMKELAAHRLVDLRERGLSKAAIYDPPGVGGTHVFFVLPHGDRSETYGLPRDPSVGPVVTFWRSGVARALGVATMFGVLVAGVLHYMRYGPLEVPDEADGKSEKEAQS